MPTQTPTMQSLLAENAELRARLEKVSRGNELSQHLHAIYDGTREYVGLLTPEGILLEANRASLTFAGSKLADVVGLPFWKTIWFQFTPGAPEAIQNAVKAAAGGNFVQFEAPIITPAGEMKTYDLSFYPIRDDADKVIFIVPEGLDITGRKQDEEALRQTHHKLQTVLDSIADGLAMLDKNWCFTYMNEQGALIVGLCPEDFIGRNVWELFPQTRGTKFQEFYHQAVATGEPLQFEEFYPEPLNLWLECRCYPSKEGLSVYFHDVTTRKQAEVLLRQNEGLFSALVEQAPTGMYVVDAQFRLQQINARALPSFVKVDPLIGRNFAEVMNILWGTELGGQLSAIFRNTLTTGEPYLAPRFSEFRQDIEEEKSYEWQTQRVTLPDGQQGVACYFNDITEKVQSEQALLEAKAAAEAANRSKDQFLAALSHELRTPLTPVLIAAETLREDVRLPSDVREQFGMIERSIALEARLIDDLFDITAISQGKFHLRAEHFDAHSLIGLAVEMVRDSAATKNIAIDRNLAAGRSGLLADPTRFQQVVWNLLRNAVKFTPDGGQVKISTSETTSADGQQWLRIEIVDSGIGIGAESLVKIFSPFEQGAATGNHRFGGLGLGLAIARAIMDLHGGKIWAESRGENQGSIFVVEFPGVMASPSGVSESSILSLARVDPANEAILINGSIRRLLVVEDHEPTLHVISTLLIRSGYHVVTAGSVADALAAAATQTFDLVISDLGLPDGTGIQLMQKMRDQYGLRGIALSGYGMEEDIKRTRAAGFVAHLVKPVRIVQLRKVLAGLS